MTKSTAQKFYLTFLILLFAGTVGYGINLLRQGDLFPGFLVLERDEVAERVEYKGRVADWLSDAPVEGAFIRTLESATYSESIQGGEFTIVAEEGSVIEISKDGYARKEVVLPYSSEVKNDLGILSIAPEGRIMYVKDDSETGKRNIFTSNLDGSEEERFIKKETDFEYFDVVINEPYSKLVYKAQDPNNRIDGFYYVINTDGTEEDIIAKQTPQGDFYKFKFSQNGKALVYEYRGSEYQISEGPEGRPGLGYWNALTGEKESTIAYFDFINWYNISPDGRYIGVYSITDTKEHTMVVLDNTTNTVVMKEVGINSFFFAGNNLYYSLNLGNGRTWFVFDLEKRVTVSVHAEEPSYWQTLRGSVLHPSDENGKALFLEPGWSLSVTDKDRLVANSIAKIELDNAYLFDYRWGPGAKYALFKVNAGEKGISLWAIDINTGKYKKIIDGLTE